MVLLLVVLPLQLEGIRGRSGYSEVALVSFRGLEKREAGCVAVVERGGGRGSWGRNCLPLMAVECMQIAIKKMRNMCPCARCASMLNMPHSHSPFFPSPATVPRWFVCALRTEAAKVFSYSASDVVQTFLPSGKQQDRSSCHWALKAQHAYLYRSLLHPIIFCSSPFPL